MRADCLKIKYYVSYKLHTWVSCFTFVSLCFPKRKVGIIVCTFRAVGRAEGGNMHRVSSRRWQVGGLGGQEPLVSTEHKRSIHPQPRSPAPFPSPVQGTA